MFNYVELIIIDVDCIIPDNHFCNNTRQNCLCILVTFSTSAIVLFQFSILYFWVIFPIFFFQTKADINENNKYNHNFEGKYCTCNRPYPDTDDEVVIIKIIVVYFRTDQIMLIYQFIKLLNINNVNSFMFFGLLFAAVIKWIL